MESVKFPRDAARILHSKLASGSWGMLAQQERDGFEHAAANRRNFELVRPLPALRELRRMLDVAYVTSLLEEEGRRATLTLGYLSEAGAAALHFIPVPFNKPLPLSAPAVAKSAPATSPARTTFGVWRHPKRGLEIWGLIQHGSQSFAIDLEHVPTYFSLRILRAGVFTVHFDQRLALVFVRDHFHLFEQSFDLMGTLRERAGLHGAVGHDLCRIAERVVAAGHGGTLLIVDRDLETQGLKMHPTFKINGAARSILKDAREAHDRAMTGEQRDAAGPLLNYVRLQRESEKKHDEALDFVAQTAAVDGAVLLDQELTLYGFGTTIATPESSVPQTVVLEDPRTPGVETEIRFEKLRGGNRHRSAVCFCAQQASLAIALVASQDGDLSMIARRADGKIHVIGPFELGVGL